VPAVSRIGREYGALLAMHRRAFFGSAGLDAVLVAIGLLFVLGGTAPFRPDVGRFFYLLTGFLFASLMEAGIRRRNAGAFSFYHRLPLDSRLALGTYYAAAVLPAAALLIVGSAILGAALPALGRTVDGALVLDRLGQALFGLFFIRSLTVNIMVALRIHAAAVAGYFLVLTALLIFFLWLQETLIPLVPFPMGAVALLLLASTYGISFLGIRRLGL